MPATPPEDRQPLPLGWYRLLGTGHVAELQSEISPSHLLSGAAVEAVAARGANDDVLLRHLANRSRFTVVHLTWSGRREPDPLFPSVEFDGTYEEFLESERRLATARDE
jgi:hypothetical protein